MKRLLAVAAMLLALNWLRDQRWTTATFEFQLVTRKPLLNAVEAAGVLEARSVALIKAEVNETILKRLVKEGDEVKPGQLMAELTDKFTRIEFDQKKNAYANALADLKKAKKDLAVERELYKSQAVARKNVDEAHRAWERAKASFEVVAQEFKLAQEKIAKTKIIAPLSGVVLKDSTIGKDQVRVDQELFLVGDVSSFIVRAKVDELDIQKIQAGQKATIELDSIPGRPLMGRVKAVAMQAEREAFAKVEVIIAVEDAGGAALKHNLSAQVRIEIDVLDDVLTVPLVAMRGRGPRSWVVVRNRRGLLERRAVTLGRATRQEAEVLSGLQAGDKVALPRKEARDSPRS